VERQLNFISSRSPFVIYNSFFSSQEGLQRQIKEKNQKYLTNIPKAHLENLNSAGSSTLQHAMELEHDNLDFHCIALHCIAVPNVVLCCIKIHTV
jgi:hypothetical protein